MIANMTCRGIVLTVCLQAGTAITLGNDESASSHPQSVLPQEQLERWLSANEMVAEHDNAGQITDVGRRIGRDFYDDAPPPSIPRNVVAALAALPTLERLNLAGTIVSDEEFLGIKGFERLRELRLNGVNLSGKALVAFRNSKALAELELDNTRNIGKGLEQIPSDSLRVLSLCGPEISDETVATVVRFHGLRKLDINTPLVTAETVLLLGKLRNLERLGIVGYRPRVDHATFFRLLPQLPNNCFPIFGIEDSPRSNGKLNHNGGRPTLTTLAAGG